MNKPSDVRLIKYNFNIILSLGVCFVLTACDKIDIKDEKTKYSYAIGLQVAQNVKRQNIPIDIKAFTAAMNDVLNDKKLQLSQEETGQALQKLAAMMQEKQKTMHEEEMKKDAGPAAENLKKGTEFLAENKKKAGVIETKSGLQYKVIKKGSGASPKATDQVEVNYEGHTIDGKVFDSSYKRKTPAQFGVSQVIPGWTEALHLMKPGAEYELYIPSTSAYGPQRQGDDIPPNSTLIFKVELLKIIK
ncbi:MAG: FKBP-type peptidyl-prolyl cis-trans isomerase [Bdellovibrionales bacterium]